MKKKQKKTHEEKVAESYFPVDPSDLGHTVEIPVKQVIESEVKEDRKKRSIEIEYKRPEREIIESAGEIKKKIRKRTIRKKENVKSNSKKIVKKQVEYKPPKINLKEDGYELIITEKPQAALKIASALSNLKNPIKRDIQRVPYYEFNKNGKNVVVACAVGHLFTLKQNIPGSTVPIFDIGWVPNYLARKNDFTKKYYDALLKLAKGAGSLTVATDYDVEGEVIGLNVVRFICSQKDAKRMKFSTLTSSELNKAYDNKMSSISWGQAIAGETRHYLDWFYGINLSRALMNSIKTTGNFRVMSIGRVQGPTLNLIVKKEREIQAFKPKTYWQVFITVKSIKDSTKLGLKHNKDIFEEAELKKFEDLVGKTAEAETRKTEQILQPQEPFNLTSLQTESYRLHGITPSKTLQIAQSLYLAGIISYPRTSSQKLPASINYRDILERVAREFNAENLIVREKPIEGKKSDPAHPSIYPTGQNGNPNMLSEDEKKIYNLIAKRFISLFCEDAIIDNKAVSVVFDDLKFSARGSSIRKKAWMDIYPIKLKENEIPDLSGVVEVIDLRTEEKETQPPKRYSPASIVSELEKRNLGTKATRANIIETLYDRGYIKEKSIEATSLGMSLIGSLKKHSPIIIDEELTRNFDNEMESIIEAKSNFLEKEKEVVEKAKEIITEISKQFEGHEKEIGKELLDANVQLRAEQKKQSTLNKCPSCNTGNLAITYSKKTRRNFIACDAYPNCKTTFSLPPQGMFKKTNKDCEECGFPMILSLRRGKRPWIFCFNPKCPTNIKRIEEYQKKKEAESK